MPGLPRRREAESLTSLDPVNPAVWLKRQHGLELFAQTLYQSDGYAATLLVAEGGDDLD